MLKANCFVVISLMLMTACDAKVKRVGSCGDGFLDPDEECDGIELRFTDCASLGYHEQIAPLTCRENCTLERRVCSGRCGDATIQTEAGEECDGENIGTYSCQELGFYGGTLACAEDCRFDKADCETYGRCGDGVRQEQDEQCDLLDLGGASCGTLGLQFTGGNLRCDSHCAYDTTDCVTSDDCGNGQLDEGEECDRDQLDGQSCGSLGYHGGDLTCRTDCRFEVADCVAVGRCGDNVIQEEYGELCDGSNLASVTCVSLGYNAGTLTCTNECAHELADCEASGRCGDGVLQGEYEDCEPGIALVADCVSLGYYGGVLSCSPECRYELASCIGVGSCGDGLWQSAFEDCDGELLGGNTCVGLGYHGGTLACSAECSWDLVSCAAVGRCGDGLRQDPFEQCDGIDLGPATCQTSGYDYGTLACGADCLFDLSDCRRGFLEYLIISEYVEGFSNNKALEIWNGYEMDVSLADCRFDFYNNGFSSVSYSVSLSGTLASGESWVVCNSSAVADLLTRCDQLTGTLSFNGDDAVALVCGEFILDVIGQIGTDPGSYWGDATQNTMDHTLRRKCGIDIGDPNGSDIFNPSEQWDVFPADTFDGLGVHQLTCK